MDFLYLSIASFIYNILYFFMRNTTKNILDVILTFGLAFFLFPIPICIYIYHHTEKQIEKDVHFKKFINKINNLKNSIEYDEFCLMFKTFKYEFISTNKSFLFKFVFLNMIKSKLKKKSKSFEFKQSNLDTLINKYL